MASIEIVPMRSEHCEEAAKGFILQRQRQRLAEPLLPANDMPDILPNLLRATLQEPDTAGWIALEGSTALAYLIGRDYLLDDEDMRRTFLPPRFCWVRYDGIMAATPDAARLLPLLWGKLADWFLQRGGIIHLVEQFHADAACDQVWRDLGFGRRNCYAVRGLTQPLDVPVVQGGIHIRRATLDDVETLLEFHFANIGYHASAPVFEYADTRMAKREEISMRHELTTTLADMRDIILLAERDSDHLVLGEMAAHTRPPLSMERYLLMHHGSTYIRDVLVRPEARGQGIGTALFTALRTELLRRGFSIAYLNFIPSNPTSSLFWPKMGFRPLTYRLDRTIDPRYLES